MITEPRPDRLLLRLCDSLERTALADMGSAEARRQLKAGLWALRNVASVLDASGALLRAEIADIEGVLAQLARYAEKPAGESSDVSPPSPRERHVALQESLAAVDRRVQAACAGGDAAASDARRILRALYRRMLARERSSGTAPPAP